MKEADNGAQTTSRDSLLEDAYQRLDVLRYRNYILRLALAWTVECSFCGAAVNQPCVTRKSGIKAEEPHKCRRDMVYDLFQNAKRLGMLNPFIKEVDNGAQTASRDSEN
jgi:hypothetical protein